MNVNRLHGLLEFEADLFCLRKTKFPSFRCCCKESASPNHRSTAKHIQPVDVRVQAARLPGVWASSILLKKNKILFLSVLLQRGAITRPPVHRKNNLTHLLRADSLRSLLELGADSVSTKHDFFVTVWLQRGAITK
jgi:hypothetical protein